MDKRINNLKEESAATIKAIDDRRVKLDADGFPQEKYEALTTAQTDLEAKDKAQVKAVEIGDSKTVEEKEIIENTKTLIGRIGNAVKSGFTNDKKVQKLFKIDEKVPKALEAFRSHCDYLAGMCTEYKTTLLKNGLTEADIDSLSTASQRMYDANTAQQTAKKNQKAATAVRDEAAKVSKSVIEGIRNYIKAKYANDQEMLIAFEPVSKSNGRNSNGGTEAPPSNPPVQ